MRLLDTGPQFLTLIGKWPRGKVDSRQTDKAKRN